jgi:hypothetical protein
LSAISKVGEVSVSVVAARASGTTVRASASSGAMGKVLNIVGDIDTDFQVRFAALSNQDS